MANRGEGTVSVLAIAGRAVTVVGKVDLHARDSQPSLPVFAPDGRTAYVTRNGDHSVSVLSVNGATVTYAGTDISANLNPYSLVITPDGAVAVTGNIGNGPTGGADTLSVLDLRVTPPRLVNTVSVGLIPEGVAMSPDGRHVAAVVMNGSNLAPHLALLQRFRIVACVSTGRDRVDARRRVSHRPLVSGRRVEPRGHDARGAVRRGARAAGRSVRRPNAAAVRADARHRITDRDQDQRGPP